MRYLTIILALMVFYLWGEQRVLRSSFLEYIKSVHFREATKMCTELSNSEQDAGLDSNIDHWTLIETKYGSHPDPIIVRYFRIGDFWHSHNADVNIYLFLTKGNTNYGCTFSPPRSATVETF